MSANHLCHMTENRRGVSASRVNFLCDCRGEPSCGIISLVVGAVSRLDDGCVLVVAIHGRCQPINATAARRFNLRAFSSANFDIIFPEWKTNTGD